MAVNAQLLDNQSIVWASYRYLTDTWVLHAHSVLSAFTKVHFIVFMFRAQIEAVISQINETHVKI